MVQYLLLFIFEVCCNLMLLANFRIFQVTEISWVGYLLVVVFVCTQIVSLLAARSGPSLQHNLAYVGRPRFVYCSVFCQ